MNMLKTPLALLLSVVAVAVLSRWLPHPPNVSPVMALALFSGLYFSRRWLAFAVPLTVMAISDLWLGWHASLPFVYLAMALAVLLGGLLRGREKVGWMAATTLSASLLFFLVSNLGVWLTGSLYPMSGSGLLQCYVAALPFLQNSLLGDAFFATAFFTAYAWQRQGLRPGSAVPAGH